MPEKPERSPERFTFIKAHLAWLPLVFFLTAICVLRFMDIRDVFPLKGLAVVLNMLFIFAVSFAISLLAARSYLRDGLRAVLCLGCGMLALALSALLTGPLGVEGTAIITVYNTGVCLSAIWVLASALLTAFAQTPVRPAKNRLVWMSGLYLAVVAIMAAVTLAATRHLLPEFYINGHFSVIRQLVMEGAIIGFLLSALMFGFMYARSRTVFLRWYAQGLALIGLGLLGVTLAAATGTPLGWVGRSAQYVGSVYMLIAMLCVAREMGVWGIPQDMADYDFSRPDARDHITYEPYERAGGFSLTFSLASTGIAHQYTPNDGWRKIGD